MKEIISILYAPHDEYSPIIRPKCLCRREPEVEYEWQIENFSMCHQVKGQALESTSFTLDSLDQSKFKLVLYPRGQEEDDDDNVTCFIDCLVQPDYNFNVTLAVQGSKSIIVTRTETFVLFGGRRIGFALLYDRQGPVTGKFAFGPDDDRLTISCIVTPEYRDPYVCDDFCAVSSDYSKLLESGDFSDFVIEGRHGDSYRVHKLILTARSHLLAKRLGLIDDKNIRHGNIIDMNPPVLRAVLYYLYCGKLVDDLSPDVLSEVYEAAKRYKMDDLKSCVFPLETHTNACTTVKVHRRTISWDLQGFHPSGIRHGDIDWPLRAFVDLTLGRFLISLSVIKGSGGKPFLQIDIHNQSVMADGSVFMKCNVLFDLRDYGVKTGLCSGEQFFDNDNAETRTFSITGDLSNLKVDVYRLEDVTLILEFALSYSGSSSKCRRTEVSNSVVNINSTCNRLHQRLSSDLDKIFRHTVCDDSHPCNIRWNLGNFSDLSIQSQSGKLIPSHRCVLSARSNNFRKYFQRDGNNPIPTFLDLANISDQTLEDFLRYVYSGKVEDLDIKRATLLYLVATKYEVPALVKTCTCLMKMKMDHSDVYALLLLADDNKDGNLLSVVQNYIRMNRSELFNSSDWESIVFTRPELAVEN